jgi:hypothetical protein
VAGPERAADGSGPAAGAGLGDRVSRRGRAPGGRRLLDGTIPHGLLLDRGFAGRAWVAAQAARGTRGVLPAGRAERRLPVAVRRLVAALHNRIETTTGELTEQLGLARHGAKTFWGLLTRPATILAPTLQLLGLV